MVSAWSGPASRRTSRPIMIGVKALFRSWAMPPASVPTASSRWARRACCSACLTAVNPDHAAEERSLALALTLDWGDLVLHLEARALPGHDLPDRPGRRLGRL